MNVSRSGYGGRRSSLRSFAVAMTSIVVCLVGGACDGPPSSGPTAAATATSSSPRLVLLYATCTLNRGALGVYGADPGETPEIDAFAQEGTVFARHLTESGQSGTAFAALFTGLHADGHGVYRHPTPLDPSVPTLLEYFRDEGWETYAWLDHGMASVELGYARGATRSFERKLEAEDGEFVELLDRLRADPEARALVVTDFTVTHGPYRATDLDHYCATREGRCAARDRDPAAFERYADLYRRTHAHLSYDFPTTRERLAMDDEHLGRLTEVVDLLYRADVARLDGMFGRVVAAVDDAGLREEALIAFTADHGETGYREDQLFHWTHGHQLAPEVLFVPWILRGGGVPVERYVGTTRSVDVFPTLARWAGLDPPALDRESSVVTGVDLSGAILSRVPIALDAYSHTALVSEPLVEASRQWDLFRRVVPSVDPRHMWVQLVRGDRILQLRRGLSDGPKPGELKAYASDLDGTAGTRSDFMGASREVSRFEQDPDLRGPLRDLDRYRRGMIEGWSRWEARSDELDPSRQEAILRSLGYISD